MASKAKSVSFCDLVNFEDPNINQEELWTEQDQPRRIKKRSSFNNDDMQRSNLMQSAIRRVHQDRQRFQVQAISDILSQTSSNFIFSRENTPANFTFPKKKNKHRTAGSDLFDIQSKGSEGKKEVENLFEGLILNQHFIGLSELVFQQVVGKQRKVNSKLINSWRGCLFSYDKNSSI